MFMLVNKVKETMETMVAKNLFTKKREETQQAIVYLEEAIEKINFMQASGDLKEDE